MNVPFSQEVATAQVAIQAIRDAGIDETDPDFLTLVESECDVLERIRKILRAARKTEADAKVLGEMISEMQERKTRFAKKAETLRTIAKQAMESLGLPRVDAPDLSASLSTGRAPLVITDEAAIPSQLCRIRREPDKTAIKKALEAGEAIPGAALGAPSSVLTVRVK